MVKAKGGIGLRQIVIATVVILTGLLLYVMQNLASDGGILTPTPSPVLSEFRNRIPQKLTRVPSKSSSSSSLAIKNRVKRSNSQTAAPRQEIEKEEIAVVAQQKEEVDLAKQQKAELEELRSAHRENRAKVKKKFNWPRPDDISPRDPQLQVQANEIKAKFEKEGKEEAGNKDVLDHFSGDQSSRTHPLYSVDDRAAFFGDIETRTSDHGYFRCIPENTSALHRFGCLMREHQRGHVALPFSDYAAHAYDREVSLLISDLVKHDYSQKVQAAGKVHDAKEKEDDHAKGGKKQPNVFDSQFGSPVNERTLEPNAMLHPILQNYFSLDEKGKIQRGGRAATTIETLIGQARRFGGEYWRAIADGFSAAREITSQHSGAAAGGLSTSSSTTSGLAWSWISAWVPLSDKNADPKKHPVGLFIDNTTSILELESSFQHLTSPEFNEQRLKLDSIGSETREGWKQAKLRFLPLIAQTNTWHLHCAWAATRLLSLATNVVDSFGKFETVRESHNTPVGGEGDTSGTSSPLSIWRRRQYNLKKPKVPRVTASGKVAEAEDTSPPEIAKNPTDADFYNHRAPWKKMLCLLLVPLSPESGLKEFEQVAQRYKDTPKGALMKGGCQHLDVHFGLSAPLENQPAGKYSYGDECVRQVRGVVEQHYAAASGVGSGKGKTLESELLNHLPGYEEPALAYKTGLFVRYRCLHADTTKLRTEATKGDKSMSAVLAISSTWQMALDTLQDGEAIKASGGSVPWWPDRHQLPKKDEVLPPKFRERAMNGFEATNMLPFDYVVVIPHNVDFHSSSFTSHFAPSPRVIAGGTTLGAPRHFSSLGLAERVFHPEQYDKIKELLGKKGNEESVIKEFEQTVESVNRAMVFNKHSQLLLEKMMHSKLCQERILPLGPGVKTELSPLILLDYIPLCIKRFSQKLTVPRLDDLSLEPISANRFFANDENTANGNYALIQDPAATGGGGESVLTDAVFSSSSRSS